MRATLRLFWFECIHVSRTPLFLWVGLAFLLVQILAILNGARILEAHRAEVAELPALLEEQRGAIARQFTPEGEAGYVAYYAFQPTSRPLSALAALSLGQRDLLPSVLWVRLLGVEGQIFEGDLKNPELLSLGSFDLAFVLCLLAPLALLVLSHDVLSRDREQGVLSLLRVQTGRFGVLLAVRLSVRLLFLLGLIVLGAGFALVRLPELAELRSLAWWLVPMGHLLFWALVASGVAVFFDTPNSTLAAALGAWVMTVVVLPVLVNLYAVARYPVAAGLDLTVEHRQVTHGFWDRPKEDAYRLFYADAPEWSHIPPVTDRFAWSWYYAMHRAADLHVTPQVKAYAEALRARASFVRGCQGWLPSTQAMALQQDIAGTDIEGHLRYLESVRRYHRELQAHFFPLVFTEANLQPRDYAAIPVYKPDPTLSDAREIVARASSPFVISFSFGALLFFFIFRRIALL